MTTVIGGSSPSITFSDSTTQTTAFNSTSAVTSVAAGTGISVSGSTGAVTISASSVTSLNGQTGVIVDTNIDAIGSVVVALYAIAAPSVGVGGSAFAQTAVNTTVAGSNLRYNYSQDVNYANGISSTFFKTVGSNATNYTGGGSSLSGTWRTMSYENRTSINSCGSYEFNWKPVLCVRIS